MPSCAASVVTTSQKSSTASAMLRRSSFWRMKAERAARMTSRRFRGEVRRKRVGGCIEFGVRNDFADEAELVGLLRGKSPSAEKQLESAVTAGDARQMGKMNGRQHADIDFRIAECRVKSCENDIAGNRHGHAAAARRAADGGDRRLAEIELSLVQLDIERVDEFANLLAGFAEQHGKVETGAKMPGDGAGEHDGARLVIGRACRKAAMTARIMPRLNALTGGRSRTMCATRLATA